MKDMFILGCGFVLGSCAALGWMWWEFKNAPLVDDEDEEYGSWNDER